jgi:hypothetical protein
MGCVFAVDDIAPVLAWLDRTAVAGHRVRPDGVELEWRQIGVTDMINDPLLPFFVEWTCGPEQHPSAGPHHDLRLTGLELAGNRDSLVAWLSDVADDPFEGVHLTWVDGDPGIVAAHLDTPNGPVRLT